MQHSIQIAFNFKRFKEFAKVFGSVVYQHTKFQFSNISGEHFISIDFEQKNPFFLSYSAHLGLISAIPIS